MHTSWTTPQSDNRDLLSLDNSGLSWTVFAPENVTVVPVRRNGNFQTRSVFLRWDPNDVTHCRILPTDKTTRWLVEATLCRRWCHCLTDQLWLLNAYDNNCPAFIKWSASCTVAMRVLLMLSWLLALPYSFTVSFVNCDHCRFQNYDLVVR